ncbi:MAG: hypothetical protein ABWU16_03190 [Halothiobacillaceae bacterium]
MCSAVVLVEGHTPHWSYHGHEGLENWGKIAAEFATGSAGKSPFWGDLSGVVEADPVWSKPI